MYREKEKIIQVLQKMYLTKSTYYCIDIFALLFVRGLYKITVNENIYPCMTRREGIFWQVRPPINTLKEAAILAERTEPPQPRTSMGTIPVLAN